MSVARTQPDPPSTVVWSSRLYLIGAALGVLGAIIIGALIPSSMVSARASASDALSTQTGSTLTADDVVAIALGVSIASIVMSIGFAVAMVLLSRRMVEGGNRARIVLMVLAVLQVVGVLGSYGVGLVHFAVVAAALVLSVLPPSNAWFRQVADARAAASPST